MGLLPRPRGAPQQPLQRRGSTTEAIPLPSLSREALGCVAGRRLAAAGRRPEGAAGGPGLGGPGPVSQSSSWLGRPDPRASQHGPTAAAAAGSLQLTAALD